VGRRDVKTALAMSNSERWRRPLRRPRTFLQESELAPIRTSPALGGPLRDPDASDD